jgi:hypothetical protein
MTTKIAPIACTLSPGDYRERASWLAELNRDALLSFRHDGLWLELVYAGRAAARVAELVERERRCCSFLSFGMFAEGDTVRVVVDAPEHAREASATLFEQFRSGKVIGADCTCISGCGEGCAESPATGDRVARAAATTGTVAALACVVCCVLPFVFPAVVATGAGAAVAAFAGTYWWALALAGVLLVSGWGLLVWRKMQTRRVIGKGTMRAMLAATLIGLVAWGWSFVEPDIIALFVK